MSNIYSLSDGRRQTDQPEGEGAFGLGWWINGVYVVLANGWLDERRRR